MPRLLAAIAALLLSCAAFAQGSGLKPSTTLGKPPAAREAPAPAPAPTPAAASAGGPDAKAIEAIFGCLSAGLPQDWRSATVEVIEIAAALNERQFEAKHSYTRAGDAKPQRLVPCDPTSAAIGVHSFNEFLDPEKRQWKRALLIFNSDGKFELKYDYAQ